MANITPQISIGLPVYNGAEYLAQAIDSILAQTLTDFELIVSDNASSDRTAEILLEYAARDSRIRVVRAAANMGAAWNFNHVARLATGRYFKWFAHDDRIAPDYLAQCAAVLDTHPDVVLCSSAVEVIDATGQVIDRPDYGLDLGAQAPRVRFHDLLIKYHLCHDIFGLMRLDVLRQTGLIGNYSHGDGILLEAMALRGRFYTLAEALFQARVHPHQSMTVYGALSQKRDNNYHLYTLWFDPTKAGKLIFPTWRQMAEHLRCVAQAPIALDDRLICYANLVHWVYRRRRPLLTDLVIAGQQLSGRAAAWRKPKPTGQDRTVQP